MHKTTHESNSQIFLVRNLAQCGTMMHMTTSTHSDYEDLRTSVVGARLRIARERRTGLEQEPFAQLINVSRGTVSNYERGRLPGGPREQLVLNAWAAACDVSVDWLRTGDEPAPTPPDGGDQGGPMLSELSDYTRKKARRSSGGRISGQSEDNSRYVAAA